MEGEKDEQRKRHVEASKVQSKSYNSKKSYSPKRDTERAEAESVPKHSPKVALTSCHLSSCRPAALTWQLSLRPWPCLCPWTSRPRRLEPFWPSVFRWWRPFPSPSPFSSRPTSSHPASTSPVNRDSRSGRVSERSPPQTQRRR